MKIRKATATNLMRLQWALVRGSMTDKQRLWRGMLVIFYDGNRRQWRDDFTLPELLVISGAVS